MDKVVSMDDRCKQFEDAHRSCSEFLEDRINRIETFVTRWIPIAIGVVFLLQILGLVYFHCTYVSIRKKVDHRYFNIIESLEEIHKVKLDNGKVIRRY